jgi:hypothetical protein
MPTLVETLRMVINGDSKSAVKAVDDLEKKVESSGTAFGKWGAGLNKAANVAAVGVVGLGALIGKSVSDYAAFAIQVAKTNAQTNMGAEATSQFIGELQMLHVNTSSAGMALKTMEKGIYGLETGSKASVAAFKILGLTWQDLKNLKPEDQIQLIRQRLSEVQDPAARAAAATTLLGRGAKDMTLWYTASSSAIAKVNSTLKANGQIMNEGQLKSAEQAAAAWQTFKGALQGFEFTLARAALPSLTELTKVLTLGLRVLRPFAPVLVPLTIALAGFVGVVKGANMVMNTWQQILRLIPAKVVAATVAEEGETVAVEANTAASGANRLAMLASLGPYALVGAAAALSAMEVYKAVQAFLSMEQAINQAKVAQQQFTSNAASDIANATAKYGANSQQVQSIQAVANAKTNKAGVSYTSGAGSAWNPFSWFAEGGSFVASKPTVIGVGEKGAEHVSITPLGKGGQAGAGGGIHIDLRGAHFSAHSPRELADQVGDVIMGRIVGNMAASNA